MGFQNQHTPYRRPSRTTNASKQQASYTRPSRWTRGDSNPRGRGKAPSPPKKSEESLLCKSTVSQHLRRISPAKEEQLPLRWTSRS